MITSNLISKYIVNAARDRATSKTMKTTKAKSIVSEKRFSCLFLISRISVNFIPSSPPYIQRREWIR